jgi:hypothetical protein
MNRAKKAANKKWKRQVASLTRKISIENGKNFLVDRESRLLSFRSHVRRLEGKLREALEPEQYSLLMSSIEEDAWDRSSAFGRQQGLAMRSRLLDVACGRLKLLWEDYGRRTDPTGQQARRLLIGLAKAAGIENLDQPMTHDVVEAASKLAVDLGRAAAPGATDRPPYTTTLADPADAAPHNRTSDP